jgi:transcriptional regulator with XRE-family HTH domain
VERSGGSVTRLDQFIVAREIDPEELARLAKVSRAHLARLRSGRSEPTKDVIVRLARSCSWLTHEKVYAWELFDRV